MKTFFVSFFLVGLSGAFTQAKSLELASPELIKKGGEVYSQNCVACHGPKGDGKGPAAAAISADAKPRDFTAGKFKFGASAKEIFNTITKGSPGTAMPPWDSMSEADRWAVTHYVRSLKKEK